MVKTDIWLQNNDWTIKFDIRVKKKKGAVYCAYIKRSTELTAMARNFGQKINISTAHGLFCHAHEKGNWSTTNALLYEPNRGTSGPCEYCAVSKANNKNTQRNDYEIVRITMETLVADQKGKVPNEMVKMYITTAKAPN